MYCNTTEFQMILLELESAHIDWQPRWIHSWPSDWPPDNMLNLRLFEGRICRGWMEPEFLVGNDCRRYSEAERWQAFDFPISRYWKKGHRISPNFWFHEKKIMFYFEQKIHFRFRPNFFFRQIEFLVRKDCNRRYFEAVRWHAFDFPSRHWEDCDMTSKIAIFSKGYYYMKSNGI